MSIANSHNTQPTIQRRKASEGVGGNKLFKRLTVEVLDSEPTHCFRVALVVLTNILLEN